jgi:glucokinase
MSKKFTIGIDLGGTNLKIALLGLQYRIKTKQILSTKSFVKKESLISAIVKAIENIIKDNRLNKKNISGVGLGLPGPIDAKHGVVHFFPNIPGWKEVRLKKILENRLRLPVFLDNDANLMALAEHVRGAARGFQNAVCITLGTGVGGGLIVDGCLYRGSGSAAGEIGHIPINEEGPACNCGGMACLETYIGNRAIIKRAERLFQRRISLEELSRLSQKGNRKAKTIWSGAGKQLGVALVGVVNLLSPDVIVIGGGVANAGKVLFDSIREIIKQRAMGVQAKQVKIVKTRLGNDAGLIGAAILVKQGLG